MSTATVNMARRREGSPEMPPCDSIKRVTSFTRAGDTDATSDGLTLDGYAAVFRQETLIDSWEGRFFESLAPGSTKKTLSETTPRLQFDHGTHPMIGSIPIGHVTSAREQKDPILAPDGGVRVVARIFDNWLTAPVRDAISEGAVDGMSFRFSVVREEWRTSGGELVKDPQALQDQLFRTWLEDVPETELLHRTLREVRIRELGPVVWPAYEGTSVGMRSKTVTIDLGAVRSGDPGERRKLAEALFVADTPAGEVENDSRDDGDEGRATLEETETRDEPEVTREAADNHSEAPSDEPEATDMAGDHSTKSSASRAEDRRRYLSDIIRRTANLPHE